MQIQLDSLSCRYCAVYYYFKKLILAQFTMLGCRFGFQ